MIEPNGLLMIEPSGPASPEPLIDSLTRKMAAAWRQCEHASDGYRGYHACRCGVYSDNLDHWVNGLLTNSLCVHYLAYHRHDVPAAELAKVEGLAYPEAEPTREELATPRLPVAPRRSRR